MEIIWAPLYYFERAKFRNSRSEYINYFTNANLCHGLSLLIIDRFEQTRAFQTSIFNGDSHESDQLNVVEIFSFEIRFRK